MSIESAFLIPEPVLDRLRRGESEPISWTTQATFVLGCTMMLELQILFLTLIPVFSGIVPHDSLSGLSPSALFGVAETVTADFLQGTWQTSDEFFKWGVTDRQKATLRSFRETGFVRFNKDGTVHMVNLFQPNEGRWEVTEKGLILKDPRYPEAPPRVVPVRKRDENRMWLLMPFSGGAIGIGLVRTPGEDIPFEELQKKAPKRAEPRRSPPPRVKPRADTAGEEEKERSSESAASQESNDAREPMP